jgi:hypothetical protein
LNWEAVLQKEFLRYCSGSCPDSPCNQTHP